MSFRFLNTVVFIIVCSTINVQESICSSLVEVKSNQEDASGVQSNMVDIHVAMESGSTSSLNIRSLIRDEVKSILRDYNNTIVDDVEEKSPISARSVKYDYRDNNLATKLENKYQAIENILKDIQAENKKSRITVDEDATCSKEENSLGVKYATYHKTTKSKKDYPKSCKEILRKGNNVSGIYEIFPTYAEAPFPVLCDMEIKGGGWTHIQKRFDGSQDFYLGWREYKFGFGNFEGEFWLGLQKLYLLSGFEPTELLVEIVDRDNVSAFAHYTSFAIGAEPGGYKLDRLSGFSGDAGDSLTAHLGSKFSTKDLDFTNDACPTKYHLDKVMNSSTTESAEGQFAIEPRFKPEDENFAAKLETIEKVLKDIQAENKKLSASIEQRNIDLIREQSVGVRCSTCIKTVKSRTEYPQNCKEIQRNGNNATGIYEIYPKHSKGPFPVLCDMDIRGGGWTHIQKRFDGSLDFNREWRDYKFGFGELEREFWLGLENIHLLTGLESVELLVEVVDRDGKSVYAYYNSFSVGPETGSYKLERLSGFSGDAGDSLTHHLGQKFSTKDIDWTERGCATRHRGGWWFFNCLWSNLNGKYTNIDLPIKQFYYIGLYWYTYKDENCLTGSRMLVRPMN